MYREEGLKGGLYKVHAELCVWWCVYAECVCVMVCVCRVCDGVCVCGSGPVHELGQGTDSRGCEFHHQRLAQGLFYPHERARGPAAVNATRTRPVLDPYSIRTRPVLDPYSIRTRPVLDPYATRIRPVLDPHSIRTRPALDRT